MTYAPLGDPLCGHEKFIWAPRAPSVTASRATSLPEGGRERGARKRAGSDNTIAMKRKPQAFSERAEGVRNGLAKICRWPKRAAKKINPFMRSDKAPDRTDFEADWPLAIPQDVLCTARVANGQKRRPLKLNYGLPLTEQAVLFILPSVEALYYALIHSGRLWSAQNMSVRV